MIPLKLWDSQKKIQTKIESHNRNIPLSVRQSGTSTLIAANILHDLLFGNHKTILLGSFKLDSTYGVLLMVKTMLESLPEYMMPENVKMSKYKIELNTCRVLGIAVPEHFDKGFSASKIYFDNISYLQPKILDKLYEYIQPVINKKTNITLVDTGSSFDYMRNMESFLCDTSYEKFNINWSDVPKLNDSSTRENIKANIGESGWRHEYDPIWKFA